MTLSRTDLQTQSTLRDFQPTLTVRASSPVNGVMFLTCQAHQGAQTRCANLQGLAPQGDATVAGDGHRPGELQHSSQAALLALLQLPVQLLRLPHNQASLHAIYAISETVNDGATTAQGNKGEHTAAFGTLLVMVYSV